MFCNKILFKCMFWLHVVLMSLLLLMRVSVLQGLFQKIENELRCRSSCLLCLHKYTVWCIFMRFVNGKMKNQNVSKNLVLVSL